MLQVNSLVHLLALVPSMYQTHADTLLAVYKLATQEATALGDCLVT